MEFEKTKVFLIRNKTIRNINNFSYKKQNEIKVL